MDSTSTTFRSPRAVLFAVGFAVFVAADDLTVVTTMLRPIMNDLGLTIPDGLDDAAWIVNAYLIAFVAVMPLAGRLSDVFGRRRLLLAAFAVFGVGTTVIPLADSMTVFLIGRVLTALGGGAMLPVALAVVGDAFREEQRARALGTLGAIETLGWVWGPLYGAMLVRFLDWRWQFWLNIPLTIIGMALLQWALAEVDTARSRQTRVDWVGALLLAATLVVLDVALLGNAEIQSVSGLEELQGGSTSFDFRLLYPIAALLGFAFARHQRRAADPLVDPAFYRGRSLRIALFVNAVVGAALIVAMVDVPIFVNAVEVDLERSAVISGWLLAALTSAMTVASVAGGRLTARSGPRVPTALGLAAATSALLIMGSTWDPGIGRIPAAAQLALLGGGLGLVFAPTTNVVVEASPPHQRGAAASMVMVVRLIGLSVGLAGLTAWSLARFNSGRASIELPPITDPDYESALTTASAALTAEAISETFLAAATLAFVGLVAAAFLHHRAAGSPSSLARATSAHPNAPSSAASREKPMLDQRLQRWLPGILLGLGGVLAIAVVAIGVLIGSLQSTRNDLASTRADLQRVEQGAAGSAIVSGQVLEITRQLAELEPTISAGLDEAIAELEAFSTSSLDFEVAVDETVTIDTEITIDRDFSFPIDETITIDQAVETTIQIDTGLGFTVPVDVNVPVTVDVPIQLDVEVPIRETVPVQAEVPVVLDLPISVDIAATELNGLTAQLAQSLRAIKDLLAGFG